jgi:hypothetical protein
MDEEKCEKNSRSFLVFFWLCCAPLFCDADSARRGRGAGEQGEGVDWDTEINLLFFVLGYVGRVLYV